MYLLLFIESSCHADFSMKFNFKRVTHALCLRQGPSDSVHLSHGDQSGWLLPLLSDPEARPWTGSCWGGRVAAAGGVHWELLHSEVSVPWVLVNHEFCFCMLLTSHEKVLKSDRIHQQSGRKPPVVLKLFNMQQTYDQVSVLTFIGHKN